MIAHISGLQQERFERSLEQKIEKAGLEAVEKGEHFPTWDEICEMGSRERFGDRPVTSFINYLCSPTVRVAQEQLESFNKGRVSFVKATEY